MSSKVPHYYTNHRQAIPWLERAIYHITMSSRVALTRNDADTVAANKAALAVLKDLVYTLRCERKQQLLEKRDHARSTKPKAHTVRRMEQKPKTIRYEKPNLVEHQTPKAA